MVINIHKTTKHIHIHTEKTKNTSKNNQPTITKTIKHKIFHSEDKENSGTKNKQTIFHMNNKTI